MLPRPPEGLVKKTVPIICKIVGIGFIVGGAIFLPIGCLLLVLHKENTTVIGAVFVGGSILQIVLGIAIVRYVPRIMIGIFQSLRDKS